MLTGSEVASLFIFEYADFQCPACRMAFNNLK
ncbi:MAG: thioredoxin domain-containing protein [Bdellovibrio sp.]|nr:thioredoxin domain-containing protein [Bdellovibrio sp.]